MGGRHSRNFSPSAIRYPNFYTFIHPWSTDLRATEPFVTIGSIKICTNIPKKLTSFLQTQNTHAHLKLMGRAPIACAPSTNTSTPLSNDNKLYRSISALTVCDIFQLFPKFKRYIHRMVVHHKDNSITCTGSITP